MYKISIYFYFSQLFLKNKFMNLPQTDNRKRQVKKNLYNNVEYRQKQPVESRC